MTLRKTKRTSAARSSGISARPSKPTAFEKAVRSPIRKKIRKRPFTSQSGEKYANASRRSSAPRSLACEMRIQKPIPKSAPARTA